MSTHAPFPHHTRRLPQGRLWFGTAAGAAAWAVHGLTMYVLVGEACKDGSGDWGALSELEMRWLLGGITIGLLAVAVTALALSFRNWRALAHRPFTDALGRDREEFMALAGVFAGACFVAGIVWAGLGPLLLDVCVTAK